MSEAKDRYINAISKVSDRYGDKLIELMNLYRVGNLSEITEEQAFKFLRKLKSGELRSRESCYFSEGEDFCKALINVNCDPSTCKFYKTEEQFVQERDHAIDLCRINGNCQSCKYTAVKCVKSSEKKA